MLVSSPSGLRHGKTEANACGHHLYRKHIHTVNYELFELESMLLRAWSLSIQ